MSSPTLLVVTLLILWLIVLVPMIFRRVDDGAQARSVRRFGRSMRLLNRRHAALASGDTDGVSYVAPRIMAARDEVFVPRVRGRTAVDVEGGRRPSSVGQEDRMHPAEMSDARRHMMARRRRSLFILGGGSAFFLLLAFIIGGTLIALAATGFCLGLGGYVYFLRTQALRDRERREVRAGRAHERPAMRAAAFAEEEYLERYEAEFEQPPETMVRIDDDNIELHNLDTIDLTDVMNDPSLRSGRPDLRQRRAS